LQTRFPVGPAFGSPRIRSAQAALYAGQFFVKHPAQAVNVLGGLAHLL
jgi:hypothetical protein